MLLQKWFNCWDYLNFKQQQKKCLEETIFYSKFLPKHQETGVFAPKLWQIVKKIPKLLWNALKLQEPFLK